MAETVKEEPVDFEEITDPVLPEYYNITDNNQENEDSKCDINLGEISSNDTDEKVDTKHNTEYYQQFLDKKSWDAGEGTSKQCDSDEDDPSGLVKSIKEELNSDNSDMEATNNDEDVDTKSLFEEQLHEVEDSSNMNTASDEDGQERTVRMEKTKNHLECQYCDYVTVTEKNLTVHIVSEHQATSNYKCKYCQYRTSKPIDFGRHVSTHFRNGIVITKSKKSQVDHKLKSNVQRDVYNVITESEKALIDHKAQEHPKSKSKSQIHCDICNLITKSKKALIDHIVQEHPKTQSNSVASSQSQLQCDVCVFTARSQKWLAYHKATQHHCTKSKHKCDKCNFTANSLTAFLNHKAKHFIQTNDVTQPIIRTKVAFKSKNQPMRMIRSVNNQQESYECIHCPFKTGSPTELGIHVAEHLKEEVECDVCLLKLESRSLLIDHKAKYHDIVL